MKYLSVVFESSEKYIDLSLCLICIGAFAFQVHLIDTVKH